MGFDDAQYFEYVRDTDRFDNGSYVAQGGTVRNTAEGWPAALQVFFNTPTPRVIQLAAGSQTLTVVGGPGLGVARGAAGAALSEVLRHTRDPGDANATVMLPTDSVWFTASPHVEWSTRGNEPFFAFYLVNGGPERLSAFCAKSGGGRPGARWGHRMERPDSYGKFVWADGATGSRSNHPLPRNLLRVRISDRSGQGAPVVVHLGPHNNQPVRTAGMTEVSREVGDAWGGARGNVLRIYRFCGQHRLHPSPLYITGWRYQVYRHAYGWAVADATEPYERPRRLLQTTASFDAATWDEAASAPVAGPLHQPRWLWTAVPAFGDGQFAYTVFAPTEPTFSEMLRRTGLPATHPARLESYFNTRGAGGTGGWRFIVHSVTHRANPTYLIGRGPGLWLAMDSKGAVTMTAAAGIPETQFYCVPRVAPRGWDIVQRATGWRLVLRDGRVEGTPLLWPPFYWDIMRGGAAPGERALHFWLPYFFSDACGARLPEDPFPSIRLQPVASAFLRITGNPHFVTEQWEKPRDQWLREVHDNPVLNNLQLVGALVSTGHYNSPSTSWTYGVYGNYQVVYDTNDPMWAVVGDWLRLGQLEMRVYQDAVSRAAHGTMEYDFSAVSGDETRWYFTAYNTFYVRNDAVFTGLWQSCIATMGPDAPLCRPILNNQGHSAATQRAARMNMLVRGACRAPGGWLTTACRAFVEDPAHVQDPIVHAALREHCAQQFTPHAHDALCACFLTDAAYSAIQKDMVDQTGIKPGTAAYGAVMGLLQNHRQPQCWYGACARAPGRPSIAECPVNTVMTCIQNMSDVNVHGARTVGTDQSCNFGDTGVGTGAGDRVAFQNPPPIEGLAATNPLAEFLSGLTEDQKKQAAAVAGAVLLALFLL
jgi:hypothetical protein